MPNIRLHGGVSYEPGHEPPGWQPTPPDDATVDAAPEDAPEPDAVAAKPETAPTPPTKKRRTLKEQLEGNGGG